MSADAAKAKTIFLEAVEKHAPPEWPQFLDEACQNQPALRERVEQLLRAHLGADSLLDSASATIGESKASRPAGTVIGPYKLLEQIGEGGMGVVYMAEQTHPVQRKVALKLIKPGLDSRAVIARFEAERQALALMEHPHIAKVLDAGTTPTGQPYFVMELVNGIPLTQYCDERRLSPRQRLELFIPVCQAIQHAHQKGIIHRDLKPSNVLVAQYDGRPVPKVIDFGVAKATGSKLTDKTVFTEFGSIVGTLEYMSPEQAERNQLDIDTRSDIYSLGVLLYELLTGTTPLDRQRLTSAAVLELLRIIKEEEPPKPSTRLSTTENLPNIAANRNLEPRKLSGILRGELDWIVMKALEKDRNRRYETANSLALDIQRYLADDAVLACPPSPAYRFRKFARRNRGTLATGALLATALLAAVVVLAVSNLLVRNERNAKDEALTAKGQALEEKDVALNEKQVALTLAQASAEEAKRQEGIAREQQRIATEQTALANRRLYASQMNLAMQAWHAGEVSRVLELLEGQRPGPDDEDLRGFEWFYLWRLCNAGRRLYLHGHTTGVLSLAYAPDGQTLASASWDRTVRLWDTTTGRETAKLLSHARGPWHVVFSPDGKTLASGGKETASLIIWDASTGKPLHTIAESADGLAFSPDGTKIVGGGPETRVWDVATGAKLFTVNEPGLALGFLADNQTIVTLANQFNDGELRFWDAETGQRQRTIPLKGAVTGALSPDRSRVVGADWTSVTIWDAATGAVQARFSGRSAPRSLAVSPDGRVLAVGSEDRIVTVWDIESQRQVARDVHLDQIWGIAFSPDGQQLASATLGGAIRLWDMSNPDDPPQISMEGARTFEFASDDATLLVGTPGPTKIIDVADRRVVGELPPRDVRVTSPGGRLLVHADGSAQVQVWNVNSGLDIAVLPLHSNVEYPGIEVSPDGRRAVTFRPWTDNSLLLWDLTTQTSRPLEFDTPVSNRCSVLCTEFSPDGQLVAAGYQFQWVTIWNVDTGQVVLQFFQGPSMMAVYALAFSPDGAALAVGTQLGTVTLWEVATGRRLAEFHGHTLAIRSLAFSPDGRTLATGSADKTVRLWDVVTGQERGTFTGHDARMRRVRFSHDGHTLAALDFDGTIKLWRAASDPEALARRTDLKSDDPDHALLQQLHSTAWSLATTDDPVERNPARAVELAQQAIELRPRSARLWNILGVARYRTGDWQAAIAAFDKADELAPGMSGYQTFFRAMALWQLGRKDAALEQYRFGSERLAQEAPHDLSWLRFQREAAATLQLSAEPDGVRPQHDDAASP